MFYISDVTFFGFLLDNSIANGYSGTSDLRIISLFNKNSSEIGMLLWVVRQKRGNLAMFKARYDLMLAETNTLRSRFGVSTGNRTQI